MNISFDKALLWGLPYLYLLSVMYYWGFWGTFDIDAFSYYAVSDLVKGVTAPIGAALVYSVGLVLVSIVIRLMDTSLKKRPSIKSTLIGLSSILVLFWMLHLVISYFLEEHPKSEPIDHNYKILITSALSTLLAIGITIVVCSFYPKNESPIREIARYGWVLLLAFLPTEAFARGKNKSLRIQQNTEFEYIIADSLATSQKCIYKYLGKTGDYHVLISLDNFKRIIVPTGKLTPLILEKFSLDDYVSTRRFQEHQKELAAPISPLLLQQPK